MRTHRATDHLANRSCYLPTQATVGDQMDNNDTSQAPNSGHQPSTSPIGLEPDRVKDEPVSGLWLLGLIAVGLLLWTNSSDPGVADATNCNPRLGYLPTGALNIDNLRACTTSDSLPHFILRDTALILSYALFFREGWRWGRRCFGWKWMRRITTSRKASLTIAVAVVSDLLENTVLVLIRLTHTYWLGPILAGLSTVKWAAILFCSFIALMALLVGLRRYMMPWTIPPGVPPDVPPNLDNGPKPIKAVTLTDGDKSGWFVAPQTGGHEPQRFEPVEYGLGLSGGGIRSAAFAGGVLQSLAGTSWSLEKAQYLSTVSGGGYTGVSTQILRHRLTSGSPDPQYYSGTAPETEFLRNHQRYLGDNALERIRTVVAIATGIALNIAIVGGLLILFGTALAGVRHLVGELMNLSEAPGAPTTWLPLSFIVILLLLVSGFFWQYGTPANQVGVSAPTSENHRSGERRARNYRSAAIIFAGIALILFPLTVPLLGTTSPIANIAIATWLLAAALLGVLGYTLNRWTNHIASKVAATAFSGMWLVLALTVVELAIDHRQEWPFTHGAGLIILSTVLALAWAFADQTWYSPHAFYKARIASTFSVRRIGPEVRPLDYDQYTYLDEWATQDNTTPHPKLLVCATANVVDVSVPPVGTRAVPWVFASDYVGSPELGWWTTEDFRRCLGKKLAPDGTLQAATAISGAAVAAALGSQGSLPSSGTALALLNARLGVWLPNPRWKFADRETSPWQTSSLRSLWLRTRNPSWLLREIAGSMPSKQRFVYVSDGGHLENLGFIELLRRRCKLIILVDASGDKTRTTGALDGALELAKQHLGIEADRDRDKPLEKGTDCVERIQITYPSGLGDNDAETGTILLAKAAFAESLRENRDAQAAHELVDAGHWPTFWPWSTRNVPKTSTLNQALTDTQYEATVLLGRAVGARAVEALQEDAPTEASRVVRLHQTSNRQTRPHQSSLPIDGGYAAVRRARVRG